MSDTPKTDAKVARWLCQPKAPEAWEIIEHARQLERELTRVVELLNEKPKPREWWLRPDPTGGQSEAWDASPSDNEQFCKKDGLVRVREVMEDDKKGNQ